MKRVTLLGWILALALGMFSPSGGALGAAAEAQMPQSVDVFKNAVFVGTRSSIGAALTELVPSTLDGNYDVVASTGSYNEMMIATKLRVGIDIYHRTFNSNTGIQHTLRIRAAPGAMVWLGGPGSTMVNRRIQVNARADSVTLEGLRVSNASDMGIMIELPDKDGTGVDDLTIVNCEFSNANNTTQGMAFGIHLNGGRVDRRLRLIGNRIYGVNAGIVLRSGQGDPANYVRVMHNLIYNLTNQDPANAGAIRVVASATQQVNPDRIEIANNTLYNFGPVGIRLEQTTRRGAAYMPTRIRVRNNIIWAVGNGFRGLQVDTPSATNAGPYLEVSDYNDLHVTSAAQVGWWGSTLAPDLNAWTTVSGHDTNSISANPLFADVINGDFHELSTGGRWSNGAWVIDPVSSPCIDAGQPDPDGPVQSSAEPVPNGGRANQGAYGGTSEASKT